MGTEILLSPRKIFASPECSKQEDCARCCWVGLLNRSCAILIFICQKERKCQKEWRNGMRKHRKVKAKSQDYTEK